MKRKKMPTQRQRTFHRAAAVAALLALLAAVRGYNFTRDQARREMEDRYGLGETQVVKELGELPAGHEKWNLYYAADRNTAVIYELEFDLRYGWSWGACVKKSYTPEKAVSASLLLLEASPGGETTAYCFGRVEVPGVERLAFRSLEPDSGALLTEETSSRRAEWVTRNEKWYFAFSVPAPTGDAEDSPRLELSGYDGEGSLVFRQGLQADRRKVFG
ncbi:MAG: hypothetical protein ACOX67_01310 [Oscillospiraceae bacterium]|jgi:hypothetical protein